MPCGQLCTVSMCHISIWVPPCNFNGPRDFFKRQKILRGWISEFFFYKDQNSNETYLQGRVKYLSLYLNIEKYIRSSNPKSLHIIFNIYSNWTNLTKIFHFLFNFHWNLSSNSYFFLFLSIIANAISPNFWSLKHMHFEGVYGTIIKMSRTSSPFIYQAESLTFIRPVSIVQLVGQCIIICIL